MSVFTRIYGTLEKIQVLCYNTGKFLKINGLYRIESTGLDSGGCAVNRYNKWFKIVLRTQNNGGCNAKIPEFMMSLLRRHKWILAGLAVYWPAIFIATHIPEFNLPRWVGQSGMGDKTLHFLSYLGLVALVWFAVSPYEKVNWRRGKVWIILAVLVWYGAADEWLQGFVGRQPEVADFYADISAALLGLTIMSIFSFWGTALVLSSIFIFTITNLTRASILFGNEMFNAAFYFLAYTFFTLVWIQFAERNLRIRPDGVKWFGVCTGVPLLVLAGLKLSSLGFGKSIWMMDIVTAGSAIVTTVIVSYVTFWCCRKNKILAAD